MVEVLLARCIALLASSIFDISGFHTFFDEIFASTEKNLHSARLASPITA